MASIRIGGDPESYMEAPTLAVGGGKDSKSKGNGGFIANLLDILGVNRQVAKGPKPKKGESTPAVPASLANGAGTQPVQPAPLSLSTPTIPALDLAAKAFDFATPHRGYVALTPPLTQIDPDSMFK